MSENGQSRVREKILKELEESERIERASRGDTALSGARTGRRASGCGDISRRPMAQLERLHTLDHRSGSKGVQLSSPARARDLETGADHRRRARDATMSV